MRLPQTRNLDSRRIASLAGSLFVALALSGGTGSAAPERPATRIRYSLHSQSLERGEAEFHQFTIPLSDLRVAYVDLKYRTPLVEALETHDLVINGGYWAYQEQERVIQGLLVVNGKRLARRHSRGGVFELRAGRARMVRGDEFVLAQKTQLAVQCHPRLVADGKVIPKLEAKRRAARTALCVTRDRTRLEAFLTLDAITLPELATFLLAQGCREALNLDGGPSTAAVARLPGGALKIGYGAALPYGLAFKAR